MPGEEKRPTKGVKRGFAGSLKGGGRVWYGKCPAVSKAWGYRPLPPHAPMFRAGVAQPRPRHPGCGFTCGLSLPLCRAHFPVAQSCVAVRVRGGWTTALATRGEAPLTPLVQHASALAACFAGVPAQSSRCQRSSLRTLHGASVWVVPESPGALVHWAGGGGGGLGRGVLEGGVREGRLGGGSRWAIWGGMRGWGV